MNIRKEDLHKYDLGKELNDLFGMSIGEAIYIKDTINKLKRISEDEYMFQRFDSITTHLVEFESSSEDSMSVWKAFTSICDYSMKYAQDRCDAISKAFDNDAATNIVSSKKFIIEQNKATTKPLSGESGFTKTLDKIADFIVYAKFDNEQEDLKHEELKKEMQRIELLKKKKRKEKEEIRLARLKEEVKDTPYSKTKKPLSPPKHFRALSTEGMMESGNGIHAVDNKINYTRVNRQMQQGVFDESMEVFWERFSPSKPNEVPHYHHEPINYKDMAYSTMNQYLTEIQSLESLTFTPDRAKQISYLKSEMRTALDILRKVITVQPSINIDETIPYDSWDRLSLRDIETYIALLFGYNEACKKYDTKVSTSYWALLRDFEDLLQKTEWAKEEAVIIEYILETGITELKDIQEELELMLNVNVSHQTLSNWINKNIPSKLHNTYEKQLEDWIWTYRRKGKYKACKKCGNIKLAVDSRYFRVDKTGKFGLRSTCKECMSL